MSIGLIIFLIVLGLLLFLVEFLVIPGVTIAGVGGAISLVSAVVLSFTYYGVTAGFITLLVILVLIGVTIALMLKSGTWKKVILTGKIDGVVDLVHREEGKVKKGDRGKAVTRLNPSGKVLINDEFYEARSLDSYVDQKTEIEVIKVEKNRLIVKPVI